MAHIDLDFAYDDETLEEAIQRTLHDFGLYDVYVLEEHGPAAGWPLVRFIGTRHSLRNLLMYAYDGENDPETFALGVAEIVGEDADDL